MFGRHVSGQRWSERRRQPRVALAVPVDFHWPAGGAIAASSARGLSTNLSAGGLCVVLRHEGGVAPGDILTVSVGIPLEARGRVPFSRIAGRCRVVRVKGRSTSPEGEQHIALAFCDDLVTRLSAIV